MYDYHYGAYSPDLMPNMSIGFADDHRLYCRNDGYGNSAAAFVAAMEDQYIVYKLPTNIAKVNLGSLSWNYNNTLFYSTELEGKAKPAADYDTAAKIWSEGYTNSTRGTVEDDNMNICIDPDGDIDLRNDTYHTTTTFKKAMKNRWLYYEKL